jgi:hypothetical protein
MAIEDPVIVHELPAQPGSGQFARRLLDEHARLEPVRLAEAQLVATELVNHFLNQGHATKIEVRLVPEVTNWRIELKSKRVSKPLEPFSQALLDGLSRRWGEESEGDSTTYWFEIKSPGTGEALLDLENRELLERASTDPLYQDEAVRRFTPLSFRPQSLAASGTKASPIGIFSKWRCSAWSRPCGDSIPPKGNSSHLRPSPWSVS